MRLPYWLPSFWLPWFVEIERETTLSFFFYGFVAAFEAFILVAKRGCHFEFL